MGRGLVSLNIHLTLTHLLSNAASLEGDRLELDWEGAKDYLAWRKPRAMDMGKRPGHEDPARADGREWEGGGVAVKLIRDQKPGSS